MRNKDKSLRGNTMKTYEEMITAWKKLEGYRKVFGSNSIQYWNAVKAYNEAFKGFIASTTVKS
jgi:phage head maturation protease